jgi:hypothetical protein
MVFDDYVQTVTQDKIVPKVVDTVLGGNLIALRFLSNGKPWSGETLKVPIKYQKNSTSQGSFDGFDTFNTTKVNTRTKMSFNPTGYYQSIVLSGMEVDVNDTQDKVLDLVKVEMESGMEDMLDSIGTLFYTVQSGKAFIGIPDIADDGTTVATYGGLARATYTGIAGTKTASGGAVTLAKMRTLYDAVTFGQHKPTLGISNETVWSLVESLYTSTVRANYDAMGYPQVTRFGTVASQAALKGEIGYDALYFRGMPLARDEKATAQALYFLNENSIQWYGLKSHKYANIDLSAQFHEGNEYDGPGVPTSYGFAWTGLKDPVNQYAEIGQILLMGQLVGKNPRLNGQLTGITSA